MESKHNIFLSGSAPIQYPADTFFALFYYGANKQVAEVPKRYPFKGEWGVPLSTCIQENPLCELPTKLDIVWLSIVEKQFYSCEMELHKDKMERKWYLKDVTDDDTVFEYIVIGMAPRGGLAIWFSGNKKQILVEWKHCDKIEVEMEDFLPNNPTLSLSQYCQYYINENVCKNISNEDFSLFESYMKQYVYCYRIIFERWENDNKEWEKYDDLSSQSNILYIEEVLYDGTYDKMHKDNLMKYHQAGKPKKLAIKWHIGKLEYLAYFWFEDERIREVFAKFYGAHPDTKTDFIIRIDAENKKYELALYRYGLKEPQIIPEDVYQILVFKNKFEDYRSDNYNQERGSWIW